MFLCTLADYFLVRWEVEGTHSIVPAKRVLVTNCSVGDHVRVDIPKQGEFKAIVLHAGKLGNIWTPLVLYINV